MTPTPLPLDPDGYPTHPPDRQLALLSSRHGLAIAHIARLSGWGVRFIRERLRAWRFAATLLNLADDPHLSPPDRTKRAWDLASSPISPAGPPDPDSRAAKALLRLARKPARQRPMTERKVAIVADRMRGHAVDVIAQRHHANIVDVVRILRDARSRLLHHPGIKPIPRRRQRRPPPLPHPSPVSPKR